LCRFGAAKIVVLEKDPYRAEFARSYCANQVYENLPYEKDETVTAYSLRMSKHIIENTLGLYRGFDVCIEASGEFECMQMGINLCKPNGTYEFPPSPKAWGSRLKLTKEKMFKWACIEGSIHKYL
jgi:threonine dehydrogenase-like Zn-dependent dehydrogenase